ncbi:MAG: tellurite resistance/C4-dicarboxylate transporter family protein [Solirubrobacteraceae bacterium]
MANEAYLLAAIPPASGGVVMGTGIVSTALSLDGSETLSRILLVVAGCVWLALGVLLAGRAAVERPRLRHEARFPAALTGVAGTAVLGTRLAVLGWGWAGVALLVVALVLWAALLTPVLTHWTRPTVGVSLMLTVSTESLAVLAATLAAREHADWLLYAALAPFLLGLGFYGFVIVRLDPRQVGVGRGDHWITGGALAICALAGGRIALGAKALATLGGGGIVEDLTLALWVLAMLWLPLLLLGEAMRPRPRYDVRRWATIFPLGMYAACSFVVGTVAGASAIVSFARVWVWVATATWLVVFGAMLLRGLQIVRDRPGRPSPL